ncbi:MAG: adenosylmethionine decarboxylase [Acholeplasmataceae bacterium]|jgi:S-adenosylmethionine decarboxylase|nr:adenosylmethionine decarboxylase [Acholeplasmataceae bacterium]
MEKLKLYGFNNLTKTLSFNIYDVCYTRTEAERKAYIEYIDEQYNSERLTRILTDVTNIIDANVLNIAKQDYDPQGASVTILISEEPLTTTSLDPSCNQGCVPKKESVVGHLDKSHLTVHTYPESHPDQNISTFRVDIDVSTCGKISPIKALNYLINSFDSDVIIMDYRVRGFTRDLEGNKHYMDHQISSIQDYIDSDVLKKYTSIDINLDHSNIFHTKMMLNQFVLDNYIFNITSDDLSDLEKEKIRTDINREIAEIFYGMNIPHMI